jgi:hypothetical protein
MTKDEIIKALRDMAKYPTVTLPRDCEALRAAADLLEQQKQEPLHPVHIGVDVTQEGTTVTAFYRKPDAVMEMFYLQFHSMAQSEEKYTYGTPLLDAMTGKKERT